MKRLLSIPLLLLLFMVGRMDQAQATHIVGAELIYECINSTTNTYRLRLKLYRDCTPASMADFDLNISLFIFNGATGGIVQTLNIPVPNNTPQIQPEDWGPCVAQIPNICVEEGIYQANVTLPPNPSGYLLAWARCCRNAAITNLANPLGEGITFLARIPGSNEAQCNNMATFDQVPPIFLCVNQPFAFDHSATDVDGDSLVYAVTNPYTGINFQGLGAGNPQLGGNQPVVDPFNNPMGAPPYNNVVFAPGFNFADPFGSGNFTIDPQTGFITVTPTQTGIFVFSISAFEYRNGILLTENRRDFQIHVIPCLDQGVPPTIEHDLSGLNFLNDTIFVQAGTPFCYDVTIQDSIPSDTLTAYTVSAAFGNGNFFPPAAAFTFSGINPIQGQVCWTPACQYNNQLVPLIVGARDVGDCENISDVFDTVWVKISIPPNDPPLIIPSYTGLVTSGDTITVTAGQAFCYTATFTDPNPGTVLTAFPLSPVFSGSGGATFTIVPGSSPLQAQICWQPGCSFAGQLIEMRIGVSDQSLCNVGSQTQYRTFIRIVPPPNAPPVLTANLSGTTFSNDTIFVDALQNLCFTLTGTDPDGAPLTLTPLGTIFSGPGAPTVAITGNNPLQAQVCWQPGCQYENQTVPLIFRLRDQGQCASVGEDFDTVYVRVRVPQNAPPVISSNLSGNTVSGDTIIVIADQGLCYTFTATDPNGQDLLTAAPLSPIFSQPNGPTFTVSGSNPVQGQVCWQPGCDFAGQTIPLVLRVQDNGACSSAQSDRDTVYIRIAVPANDPPTITPNLTGLNFNQDTIFADATENFCFQVVFSDPNSADTLIAEAIGAVFSGANPASFSVLGVNPLIAQVCWTPDCANEGQTIPFIFRTEDNGRCDNILDAFDTVFVKISDPQTVAPIVDSDLSGNVFQGDTILLETGGSGCYEFYIADQTPGNGVAYEHEFQQLLGANLVVGSVTTITRNDSILGRVCFETDCSNGGSYYRSIVIGRDKETCPPFKEARDTVIIKVNTSFMSFAGRDTAFCEGGGGVQLNVTPIGGVQPYYYQWYCDNPGNCGFTSGNSNIADPIANPTETTTYYVQVTDFNGCTSEIDDITVKVDKLPIVDAGPDQAICEGSLGTGLQCTIVNAQEAPGPYTYTWFPSAGLSSANSPNPFARPDTTTIYTVIVTAGNGCSSRNTTLDTLSTVIVTVKERPIVNAGRDTAICLGGTTQLLAFAEKAGPDYTYIWTPSVGLSDSSAQTPIASPPLTTTFFVVAWSNGCPSVADSMTLTVRTIPTLEAPQAYEACAGDSVQLSTTAGGDPLASGYSFVWTPAAGLSNPFIPNPKAAPDQTTVYRVRASSDFGCGSDEASIVLNILPKPIPNAGQDTALCRGDTLRLNATHVMAGGAPNFPVFYTWSPAEALSSAFVADPLASPVRTTLYTVRTSSGACAAEDQILITVQAPVSVAISADTFRLCSGDSVQLRAAGGNGNGQFAWTPAAGLDDPSRAAPWASPDTTTTYTVLLTEGVCEAQDAFRIEVRPTPVIDYFASQESGCEVLTVNFLENIALPVASFIWDFGDGSPLSNDPDPTHTFSEPGVYPVRLTATSPGGCSASAVVRQVTVTARGEAAIAASPASPEPVLLPDAAVQFSSNSSGATAWFWDFGDGGYSDEANPLHVYQQAGSYTVTLIITDAGGCIDTARYAPVVIAIPDLFIPNVFSPNEDGVNDRFWVEYTGKDRFSLQVFDRWGRKMFGEEANAANSWDGRTPEGGPAEVGVYYYVLQIGEQRFTGNVTLLR
ncbi:MAG: PKD domain-containing protein [Bacteroidia bacterium]|nr:PKD domain-containing protein [Bacteroidia bacterium]